MSNEPMARITELESEVARLRAENEKLHILSDAYLLEGLPRTEEEYRGMVASARPFRELLQELEAKHGVAEAS